MLNMKYYSYFYIVVAQLSGIRVVEFARKKGKYDQRALAHARQLSHIDMDYWGNTSQPLLF